MMAARGLGSRLGLLEIVNEKLPDLLRAQNRKEYVELLGNADLRTQTEAVRILSTLGGQKKQPIAGSNDARNLARQVIISSLEYEMVVGLIREMSLVYLVSEFESFLQQMISLTLQKMPGPILERTLTLKELEEWKNVRQAKYRIIEKEIHDIRLTNPDEADDYFSKKFRIRLSALPQWSEFKERFYRRHVIIHRRGEPDRKYRERTGRKRLKLLEVSQNYLAHSIILFSATARRVARELEKRFGTEWTNF